MTVESTAPPTHWVGQRVLRKEDPRLLTGQGAFIDDLALPRMLWISMVRSPAAHARIVGVDVGPALQMPGVVAAYSGNDLADQWAAGLPCAWPVTPGTRVPDHWPVAKDRARFAGDAVAVVVAETREQAADAAAAVEVDYDPLPAVLSIEHARSDGAPLVWDEYGDNYCFNDFKMSVGDVEKVFSEAPVVVKERYYHPRLIPNAMEPRGVLVQPVPAVGELTMWSSTQ